MKPYIFGKRNLIHIINVKETLRGILAARKFLAKVVSQGKDIVFVGTKRQARKAIQEGADEVGMHWVIDRWLGGTLTNFREIRRRVTRLEELEQMEADGLMDAYSKKQGSKLRREMRKITRNLGGIRKMTSLPGAMVVVDQRREVIAIREARKLHIPVICLIDTDSDPDLVDIPIPGNDDAMKAISLVVGAMVEATQGGIHSRVDKADQAATPPRRRSRRATTARAEHATATAAPAAAEPPQAAAASVAEVHATQETPLPTPAGETPVETVPEPVAEPVPEPSPGPVVEPAVEVVEVVDIVEPVAETAPEPAPEPVAEPTPEPVAEPAPEPVAEPAVEVVEVVEIVEPVAEPAPEPAVEPIADADTTDDKPQA